MTLKIRPAFLCLLLNISAVGLPQICGANFFMKEIPLTRGMVALVDDADFEWLNQWKWYAFRVSVNKEGVPYFYPSHSLWQKGQNRSKVIMMHRFIMGVTDTKILVDHKDRNTLNCQRSNLRLCTKAQNCRNRRKLEGTRSAYIGVSPTGNPINKWMAKIRCNLKQKYLGSYQTEIEAATAYNEAAKKYFGEFASLNIL